MTHTQLIDTFNHTLLFSQSLLSLPYVIRSRISYIPTSDSHCYDCMIDDIDPADPQHSWGLIHCSDDVVIITA